MSQLTVFYSWQSDRPSKVGRNFIAVALAKAAERVGQRRGVEIKIDSDTQGVPGTPPVSDTILKKIAACDVFLADMTFVASTEEGKHTPNPNVLVEYGYALAEKGVANIILVMDAHFGAAEALPFDLRHLRHPLDYDVAPSATDAERRRARDLFSEKLENALDTVLQSRAASPALATPDLRQRLMDVVVATQNARVTSDPPVLVSTPHAAVFVVPTAALSGPRMNLQTVANVRHLLAPSVNLRIDEGLDQRQWWAHGKPRRVGDRPNPEALWCTRLLRPGVVEHFITLGERIADDPWTAVDGRQVEGALVQRLDRSLQLLDALGLEGPTLVAVALYGLDEVRLTSGRGLGRFRTLNLGFDAVLIPKGARESGSHLRPLFDDFWLAAGSSAGSPSFDDDDHWAGYDTPALYEGI